jgi:hypothetical protein
MLCYIMSCSEEWVFYRAKSMEILGCGRDKYQKVIRELKEAGYLVIHAKRGESGRLDGQEWEVIDEPAQKGPSGSATSTTQDVAGHGPETTQDEVPGGDHRGPENQAPGAEGQNAAHRGPEKTARRCEPDAGESGPLRKNNKQKEKLSSCAADAPHKSDFDFAGFFDQFADAFPRMGDAEKTQDALRKALGEGADPAEILAGAKAYAVEQQGNQPRYIKYSENWIEDKRWRQHVTKPVAAVDPQKVLEERAKDIQARKPWARTIKASQAGECITAGLVTVAQCQAAGINV